MSSWQLYIDNMMATGNCGDVVFVGFEGTPSVWASVPDGNLSKITSDQIRCLVQTDGSGSFTNGVMLGTKKYMLVQDNWAEERYLCLIGKSETGEDLHAAVAKSNKEFSWTSTDLTCGLDSHAREQYSAVEYTRATAAVRRV
uniref:profilin-1-like isoform X1 n=1 Tax=Pristiophorus japonicus TaxID=55135 RepID=UPI00398EE25B